MPGRTTIAPVTLFYSYAHEDETLRKQLELHLSLLHRQGLLSSWHDRAILPGTDWAGAIDKYLNGANIILLLVSASFLASDYCYDREMVRALERHKLGEARVIPIIMRPCDWQHSPFAHLQCLPRNIKPITTWSNQDEAFVSITQELRKIIVQHASNPPVSNYLGQNRVRLLKQVHKIWINGLLEQSLHHAVEINLHFQDQPDALKNPWRFQVQELNQRPRALPVGTNIIEVYDEADGKLLILGEPGSGKTTLLLQLAKTLLDRANADERQLIPVVFSLSSWVKKQKYLATWLVEELVTKYEVSRRVAQNWIDTDSILPLLDGLDEVAEDSRNPCVQAIDAYCSRHPDQPNSPLVVCCRSKDYHELSSSLLVNYAVQILSLTDEQIDAYFSTADSQLEGLRHLLLTDAHFSELPRTPLMLDIFVLAFQGKRLFNFPSKDNFPSKTNFPSASPEQILRVVFDTYVERMLSRRKQSQSWTKEQFRHWLTFLAKQTRERQQTFLIKDLLQPTRLEGLQKHLYQWSSSLLIGLIAGLMVGLYFRLLIGPEAGLLGGVLTGLCAGPLIRMFVNVLAWISRKKPNRLIALSKNRVYILFTVELIIGVLGGLLLWRCFGLLFGGFSGMLIGLFTLAWFSGISSLYQALGPGYAPGSRPVVDEYDSWLITKINGPIGKAFFWLFVTILVGLGIGLPTGLRFGLGIGLFFWLLGMLLPFIWFFIFREFLRPFLVRFWLWCLKSLPWDLVPVLDEAADRLLLRKVGNSYIFVHRLLLEYFASLDNKSASDKVTPLETKRKMW
jgi:eukaryotic-like serine/threonine-protein kinase